jgi:DNA (cytosine-5)-methyltransferase 1
MKASIVLNILRDFTKEEIHEFYLHPEFEAIVTSWLQNPSILQPYMNSKIEKRWLSCLKEHSIDISEIDFSEFPFPPPPNPKFKFIDLFAGIGGFRLALQKFEGKSVFSSEWDSSAKLTYSMNFGETPFGDINQFTNSDVSDEMLRKLIPNHDILTAGFPCQPFSKAGVSARKSLGHLHGFECETQGTLFFSIVRIAKVKQPRVLFLENVKNIMGHDNGKTFNIIKTTIENELNYSFSPKIIDSSPLVPQRRQRCYMVCIRDKEFKFEFPDISGKPLPLSSILEKNISESYTISRKLWQGHIERSERNVKRGTGFTAYTVDLKKPANTLVARYGKDGKECLIPQKGKNPRMLTERECARIQGFPEEFLPAKYRTPAYKQFGNAVSVPVVREIAKKLIRDLNSK